MTFRWKSLATIYAIFFYIGMTVVVYYVGLERIRILGETKKFDEKIYAYIFVIFLVPHFWIPFVGWGKLVSVVPMQQITTTTITIIQLLFEETIQNRTKDAIRIR